MFAKIQSLFIKKPTQRLSGKNCYEKEKVLLFAQQHYKFKLLFKLTILFLKKIMKTCLLPFQKMIYQTFLEMAQSFHHPSFFQRNVAVLLLTLGVSRH